MFIVIEGSGSGDKTQEAKGPVTAATASQMPARELVKPESDINKERLQIEVCYINL